jgi:hypothetical protein
MPKQCPANRSDEPLRTHGAQAALSQPLRRTLTHPRCASSTCFADFDAPLRTHGAQAALSHPIRRSLTHPRCASGAQSPDPAVPYAPTVRKRRSVTRSGGPLRTHGAQAVLSQVLRRSLTHPRCVSNACFADFDVPLRTHGAQAVLSHPIRRSLTHPQCVSTYKLIDSLSQRVISTQSPLEAKK